MASEGTILEQAMTKMGITSNGAEGAPVETPADGLTPGVGTPEVVENAPTTSAEAQSAPDVQGLQVENEKLKKSEKDHHAAYTRSQQELAEMKRKAAEYERRLASFTPAEMAVAQTVQATAPVETEGQAAMRRLIESNPEIIDDPQKQVRLMGNISANTTLQMIRDYDAMKSYAAEAKQVLGEDFNPAAYEADAWEAYQIHRKLGKTGNPFLSAVAVVNQDMLRTKLATIPQKEAELKEREVQQRSSVRMERPGVPVGNSAGVKAKLNDQDFCKLYLQNNPDKFQTFSRR